MSKMDVKKTFGNSVKARRRQRGFSQEQLAERADLHRTYISDVERGARNLSLESMSKLAGALEIPVAALFPPELSDGTIDVPRKNCPSEEFVNILLVEDNGDDAEMTLHAFQQARFANRVQVAADGQTALDYLFCQGTYAGRQPGNPQIVLLDLNLPKVSGIEVLRLIKLDKRTRQIPVVVLTTSQMFSDFEECQRLGAETFIVKPLNFQRLSQITPRLNLDWALLKPAVANLQPVGG